MSFFFTKLEMFSLNIFTHRSLILCSLSLSSFWHPHDVNIAMLEVVPVAPYTILIFWILFYFCCSKWVSFTSISSEIILGIYKCNYSLTVKELKLHSAFWRQIWGWCGPQWKWVWHPWSRVLFCSFLWDIFLCFLILSVNLYWFLSIR